MNGSVHTLSRQGGRRYPQMGSTPSIMARGTAAPPFTLLCCTEFIPSQRTTDYTADQRTTTYESECEC